jgi:hypothetical protein
VRPIHAGPRSLRAAAAVAVLFGVLTIASGGRVLFGPPQAAAGAGDVVPFVLWFNFAAGFAYVAAGIGLWRLRRWGAWTAAAIAGATLLAFALFGLHALSGAAFETRTAWAMALRSAAWVVIATLGCSHAARFAQPGGRGARD